MSQLGMTEFALQLMPSVLLAEPPADLSDSERLRD